MQKEKTVKRKNNQIEISIVIATYNSQKTLPLVLEALKKQTFPQKNRETLIIDGGSTDSTKTIAKSYNSTVINNPKTEPVHAKLLGYQHAKGTYIVYLDHDEVLENPESLSLKYEICEKNESIRAVIGSGYKSPNGYTFINDYINEFGDPFSFFIYRLSKDARYFLPTMGKRYMLTKNKKEYSVFSFSEERALPIIELCAAASMVDREFMIKNFPETKTDLSLIPHFFYLLLKKSPTIAITKNDALIHYSSESLGKYLKKINWRIKNNIYHIASLGKSGYTGRSEFSGMENAYKRYLFIPYSFLLVPSLIDSLYLMTTRRNIRYLSHVGLCFYTASVIMYHTVRKAFGYRPELRNYDESVVVSHVL